MSRSRFENGNLFDGVGFGAINGDQAAAASSEFADIENKSLRDFLVGIRGAIKADGRAWPLPASILHRIRVYSTAMAIQSDKLSMIIGDVNRKGILVSVDDDPRSPRYDKDRLYAFGALAWSIGQQYSGRTEAGRVIITDSREAMPWQEIVDQARGALGQSHFAQLIHDPKAA